MMMEEYPVNEPIGVMSTPQSLKLPPSLSSSPPLSTGQTSPRSPLECDFDTSGKLPSKKTVNFAPGVQVAKISIVSSFSPTKETTAIATTATVMTTETSIKRKVSWSSSVMFREIRHIRDFSQDEIETIWMTMPEYQMIKAFVKTTVVMMMKGEFVDEVNFSCRGLEFRTRAGSKMRSRNKLRARSAVLNEQDLQREEGFCDPQYIAMACMEESLICRQGAHQRALYDQQVVQGFLNEVQVFR